MSKYLLSIVIPTRNRQYYCENTVKEILSNTSEKTQIVIHDNSDSNDLYHKINRLEEKRIKYVYEPKILSFVDNFDLAVSLADGEYVCLLGDDDGVIDNIEKVTMWAKDNSYEAVNQPSVSSYFWPNSGIKTMDGDGTDGYLTIEEYRYSYKVESSQNGLKKLLNYGGQHYLKCGLVKLYQGIVSRELIQRARKKYGTVIKGLSPDIYASVILSLEVKDVIVLEYPFIIVGACGSSGTSDSAKGKHTGRLEDAPHFRGHNNYKWNQFVPKVYSVETIWAESALAAICDAKHDDLLNYFNHKLLLAEIYFNNKSIRKLTIEEYKRIYDDFSYFSLYKNILFGPFFNLLRRGFIRIKNFGKCSFVEHDVNTIQEAAKIINSRINGGE